MSEHMIYIKNVTNVTPRLHQNVANVTKQNIASKEILTIEFHTKYMKLFVNMLSIIYVLLNTKFHNTSENFYFEVIWSRTIVSCQVTTWPIVTWTLFLTLTKKLIFKDLYVLTRTGSTIINQKLVDSMFAPGAVAIQKWNFPLFWSQTWRWNRPWSICTTGLKYAWSRITKWDINSVQFQVGSDVYAQLLTFYQIMRVNVILQSLYVCAKEM